MRYDVYEVDYRHGSDTPGYCVDPLFVLFGDRYGPGSKTPGGGGRGQDMYCGTRSAIPSFEYALYEDCARVPCASPSPCDKGEGCGADVTVQAKGTLNRYCCAKGPEYNPSARPGGAPA